MSETIYLESTFARISNAWFVFRERSYRVHDVHSVATRTVGSNRNLLFAAFYLPVGAVLLALMLFGRDTDLLSGLSEIPVVGGFIYILNGCLLILSVILALALVYSLYSLVITPRSYIYLILLHGTFGKSTAFASLDRSATERIVEAVNKALADKAPAEGQPPPLVDREAQSDSEQSSQEDTYLTDGVVSITPWEVKVDEKSYPRPSIKSARLSEVQVDSISDLLDLVFFVGLLFWVTKMFYEWLVDNPTDPNHGLFSALGLAGILMWPIALLIKDRRQATKAYVVELRGTFGRANALATMDEAYAKMIVDAIEPPRKRRASSKDTTSGPVSN
ncbi:MAG TPA: DUF6232 family protein [Chloroflexia bacterium]|nr:DUF6232 family protein [Chloroflexia bacterium]